jgi:hypothetical protein
MPIELGSFSLGTVAGGAVGAVIAHYLTKDRDQAGKFNDATADIFVAVSKHVEGIGGGINIDAKTRLLIEHYFPKFKRGGFRNTVKNYNDAHNCSDGIFDPVTGGGTTINEAKVQHYASCAEKLLCYLKRR